MVRIWIRNSLRLFFLFSSFIRDYPNLNECQEHEQTRLHCGARIQTPYSNSTMYSLLFIENYHENKNAEYIRCHLKVKPNTPKCLRKTEKTYEIQNYKLIKKHSATRNNLRLSKIVSISFTHIMIFLTKNYNKTASIKLLSSFLSHIILRLIFFYLCV